METVWKSRLTATAARYGEVAPQAGVCCNACRTCVQANAIGLLLAGIGAAGVALTRLVRPRRRA